MAIVRMSPLREIDTFHRQVNRLFDDLGFSATLRERGIAPLVPAAELVETEDALLLKLELPGIDPNKVTVEATAESVSIAGERQASSESADQSTTRSEFRYGKFHRVIPLPLRIQNTSVQADYKNGILSLTLPKAEEEKNKVVKVNIR